MKYVLTVLLCFTMLASSAQISDKQLKENMAKLDSQTKDLNESMNRSMHTIDSINMARDAAQMSRNMDAFLAERKEQQRKQWRSAYIRIGFGVLMLVVLIVGWARKRKGKQ